MLELSSARNPSSANDMLLQLSRRDVLKTGAALGLSMLVGCGSNKETSITLPSTQTQDSLVKVDIKDSHAGPTPGMLDPDYLGELITKLQAKQADRSKRITAATKALRVITNFTHTSEATAFQLDECGIYLTAKHAVPIATNIGPGKDLLAISDITKGVASYSTAIIRHATADLAVVYAPTGSPLKPTEDLQFDLNGLHNDEDLWLLGYYHEVDWFGLATKTGQLDYNIPFKDKLLDGQLQAVKEAELGVKGMLPFGGMSGGPILNAGGVVVGVESGVYPEDAKDRSEYLGARITPLSYVSTFPTEQLYLST